MYDTPRKIIIDINDSKGNNKVEHPLRKGGETLQRLRVTVTKKSGIIPRR